MERDLDAMADRHELGRRQQDSAGREVDGLAAELIPRGPVAVKALHDDGDGRVDAEKGTLILGHTLLIACGAGGETPPLGECAARHVSSTQPWRIS